MGLYPRVTEHRASTIQLGVKAATCVASGSHDPTPLRYVWHHVMPQEAGGPTVQTNLIQVCDTCHYTIHRLMWQLANNLPLDHPPRRMQLAFATQGYNACLTAGTVHLIPDEG